MNSLRVLKDVKTVCLDKKKQQPAELLNLHLVGDVTVLDVKTFLFTNSVIHLYVEQIDST